MNFDISHLLEQWDYQPGQVVVRKFVGKDGLEKIQLRIDLGLLQMNAQGRPDGKRPFGHPTLFDFHLAKLEQYRVTHNGSDEEFVLSGEDCAKLQLEAFQYHHRYVCLLQLEDYAGVVRDTTRNLKVFDFVEEYAESDEMAWSLQQFRAQVLMLQTRGAAAQFLENEEYPVLVDILRNTINRILGNIDELLKLPGATLTRVGENRISLPEIRVNLENLLEFRVQPLFRMVLGSGVVSAKIGTTTTPCENGGGNTPGSASCPSARPSPPPR